MDPVLFQSNFDSTVVNAGFSRLIPLTPPLNDRYHVGESMLASIRHFLRFIDVDSKFDEYGFTTKVRIETSIDSQ